MDVAGFEHGLGAERIARLIESASDAGLAFLEPAAEDRFHLKSFVFSGGCGLCNPTNTGKHEGFQAFRFSPTSICQWRRLVKG
ncbi:hypothetical protein FRUB_09513 [Fimbriiglobus ruber]|uniref:Uncharacterized protein n=1 Tax=Fimbriiglobus ruber TaxID=1908690 RepID=A0A225D1F6_9BACT|nr:hypothetical protein FRUB_09513 [Fimbriiglobus ruber]